ncbi:MAG: hypothetical protein V4690_00275 [Patescibacteria group bacterium]
MTDFQIKAVVAGFCFGVWPLIMNKSGLSGGMSSVVLTIIVLMVVGSASWSELGKVANVNWIVVVTASIISGIGLLMFNRGIAITAAQEVSVFFLTVLLAQMLVPALYHVFQNGISTYKLIGFGCAALAAYFLNK